MSKLGRQAARGVLVATFGGSTALAYGLVRREGEPAVPGSGDIALLGVATFKLSRFVTKAKVTEFVREPFVEGVEPGAEVEEELPVEARPHLASEHEVVPVEVADEERAEADTGPERVGEAPNDELL